jgi:hypothetical protein
MLVGHNPVLEDLLVMLTSRSPFHCKMPYLRHGDHPFSCDALVRDQTRDGHSALVDLPKTLSGIANSFLKRKLFPSLLNHKSEKRVVCLSKRRGFSLLREFFRSLLKEFFI